MLVAGNLCEQLVATQVPHDVLISALMLLMIAWHPAVMYSQAVLCQAHVVRILIAFPISPIPQPKGHMRVTPSSAFDPVQVRCMLHSLSFRSLWNDGAWQRAVGAFLTGT